MKYIPILYNTRISDTGCPEHYTCEALKATAANGSLFFKTQIPDVILLDFLLSRYGMLIKFLFGLLSDALVNTVLPGCPIVILFLINIIIVIYLQLKALLAFIVAFALV